MASNTPLVSTGRGGTGNIGRDTREYADGEIVREGVAGESNRPEFSSGRGGAGNIISSPRVGAQGASHDVVPDTAMLSEGTPGSGAYHTGRGGEGNVQKPEAQLQALGKGDSLLNKAKELFHGREKVKEKSDSSS